MMTTLNNNIPELRFNEFAETWKEERLKTFIEHHKGGAPLKPKDFVKESVYEVIPKKAITSGGRLALDEDSPTYCSECFYLNNQSSVVDNSYLITTLRDLVPSGPNIGYIVKNNSTKDYLLAQGVYGIKIITNELNQVYLIQYSNRSSYRKLMQTIMVGSTQVHIRNPDFFKIMLHLPSLPEQKKIADFLSSVDTRISQLTRNKSLLEKYKKGIMQKIFKQQIRFKDDNGNDFPDWQEKKLGDVCERIKRKNTENNKNVLTISAQQGLINQKEYFNKSVSAKDVTGYYLLHKDDFAYNKSYSAGYPMGAIKRLNRYDKGVVSTLYICFKIINGNIKSFFEQLFDNGILNKEIGTIAQEGARNHGLLNVSVVEFFKDINVPVPSIPEQQKIADFLSAIDRKIDLANTELAKAQEFKKGLLQQMFV